jgi:hypothetical protein
VRRLASPSLFTLFISSSTVLLKGFFQHAFLTNFFILNHMRWIDPRVNAIAADTAADNFAAEDPDRLIIYFAYKFVLINMHEVLNSILITSLQRKNIYNLLLKLISFLKLLNIINKIIKHYKIMRWLYFF